MGKQLFPRLIRKVFLEGSRTLSQFSGFTGGDSCGVLKIGEAPDFKGAGRTCYYEGLDCESNISDEDLSIACDGESLLDPRGPVLVETSHGLVSDGKSKDHSFERCFI